MKKFTSAIIALLCCFCTFFISVSATDDEEQDGDSTYLDYAIDSIADYQRVINGDMTAQQFFDKVNQRQGTSYYYNVVDKTVLFQVLQGFGVDTDSFYKQYVQQNYGDDYDNSKLNGHGASAVERIDGGFISYYGDYGILNTDGSGTIYNCQTAVISVNSGSDTVSYGGMNVSINSGFSYYGDWRNLDGSPVPKMDMPVAPDSPSELSDDMFQKFLDELKSLLASLNIKGIENLLQTINATLQSINSNMVTHSDIQSIINAINALSSPSGSSDYTYIPQKNEDGTDKDMFDFSSASLSNSFGDSKKSINQSAAEVIANRLKPFIRISVVARHVINSIDGNPIQIYVPINGESHLVFDFATFNNYIDYIRVLTVGILYFALGWRLFKDISKVIANGG